MTGTALAIAPTAGQLDAAQLPPLELLAGAWLASLRTVNTRNAYRRDLAAFDTWATGHGLDVLAATRPAVDLYRIALEEQGLAPATVARRLSALASFYAYATDAGILPASPVARVARPRVSDESPTLGLDRDEAGAFLTAAAEAGPRDEALACLLVLNGLRVSEAAGLDVADLTTERGHRIATVTGKGGKVRRAPLAPRTVAALDAHIAGRTTGPVFAGHDGAPMSRHAAARTVARLARRAGIDGKKITPHSCRHTMVTLSLDAGVPLRDVQDAAGHASPETTRRYDRARHSLDRHATYTLAAFLADDAEGVA